MSSLESIRILVAISIFLVGYATTGMILSSVALFPGQIDTITLISLDETLSREIDEALAQSTNFRRSEADDKTAETVQSLIEGIIAEEILASGAKLTDFLNDGEQPEFAYDWNAVEESDNAQDHHSHYFRNHRRLTEDSSENNLATAILPQLILALAGLVILCAIFLCIFDVKGGPKNDENEEENESQEVSPSETVFSITSIAQNSYFSPLEAAQNPILPPDEEEALIESYDTIQIVPSASHENRTKQEHGEKLLDEEQKTNPVARKDLFPYPRNVIVGDTPSIADEGDAPPIIADGSSSPDRSAISSLTEPSVFSSELDKLSLSSSHSGMDTDIKETKESVEAKSLHSSDVENTPSCTPHDYGSKVYHDTLSRSSSNHKDHVLSENDVSEKFHMRKDSTSNSRTASFEDGLQNERLLRDQDLEQTNHPPKEHQGMGDVIASQSSPEKHTVNSISTDASNSTIKNHDYIRDIMLIGEQDGLGLETCSTTSDNHPIVTHVKEYSPLVGRVFEGDVILNVSDSNNGDEANNEENRVLFLKPQGAPRCIQLTILSSHKDEESYTDATTTIGDESAEKCEV